VEICCGDSRNIEFPECDLVLTSPPYVGLIDYHEQHRYAYELLGLNWNAENEIGPASVGNSSVAQKAYLDQIEQVFLNLKQYLKKTAHLVVVVHDRKNLYRELSKRLGFRTQAELHRHINRRTGRRAGDFFESVFVWRPDKL
jgi:DNA modification methylase